MVRIFSAFVFVSLIGLAGCAVTTEQGAFDVAGDRTGKTDSKGFPVFVGEKYDRDVPLKRSIERLRLESELQAIADSRKNPSINVDKRRDELLQQRLLEIARTHGAEAEAEIQAACQTDNNGVVHCKGD